MAPTIPPVAAETLVSAVSSDVNIRNFTELCMGRDGRVEQGQVEILVARLVKETNISEKQARDLIEMIGVDWASLVREARFLKGRH